MLEVSWQYKSGLVTMNGSWISHDDQSSLPSYHVYNGGPFAYPAETARMQSWFIRTMNTGALLKKIYLFVSRVRVCTGNNEWVLDIS